MHIMNSLTVAYLMALFYYIFIIVSLFLPLGVCGPGAKNKRLKQIRLAARSPDASSSAEQKDSILRTELKSAVNRN